MSHPASLGLIVNAAARRVRRHYLGRAPFWQALLLERQVRVTRTLVELEQAVAEFQAEGVAVVAALGGDGTLQRAADALVSHYDPSSLPTVLALAGGTMNGLPRWFGSGGPPAQTLARVLHVLACGAALPTRNCRLLRVHDATLGTVRYGFGFGAGLVVRAFEEYYRNAEPGLLDALRAASLPLTGAVVGGDFYRRLRLEVEVTGAEWLGDAHTVVASVTDHPVLWFRPFGAPLGEVAAFHLAATAMRPLELAPRLWSIFRGRCRHPRLRIGQVDEMTLRGEGGYVMDGELHRADAVDVRLTVGPRLRFWAPDGTG